MRVREPEEDFEQQKYRLPNLAVHISPRPLRDTSCVSCGPYEHVCAVAAKLFLLVSQIPGGNRAALDRMLSGKVMRE